MQNRHPFIAAYCLVCVVAAFGLLIIFAFTHEQSRVGTNKDMNRIACTYAYGQYDAQKDTCNIRN